MKKSRYSPEQAAFGLRQAEEGIPVSEVCMKMGISEQTFYRWKKRTASSSSWWPLGLMRVGPWTS